MQQLQLFCGFLICGSCAVFEKVNHGIRKRADTGRTAVLKVWNQVASFALRVLVCIVQEKGALRLKLKVSYGSHIFRC